MKTLFKLLFFVTLFTCCEKENEPSVSLVIPDFIDVVDGKVTISKTSILCEITLKELPGKLIFDQEILPSNALEYEWGVFFDNDNDGNNDISISMTNWKFAEEKERIGKIIINTQQNVWLISNNRGSWLTGATATIDGNTITLYVDNIIGELSNIDLNSTIEYRSKYNDGEEIYNDLFK